LVKPLGSNYTALESKMEGEAALCPGTRRSTEPCIVRSVACSTRAAGIPSNFSCTKSLFVTLLSFYDEINSWLVAVSWPGGLSIIHLKCPEGM
jgi:hypothetical protein